MRAQYVKFRLASVAFALFRVQGLPKLLDFSKTVKKTDSLGIIGSASTVVTAFVNVC